MSVVEAIMSRPKVLVTSCDTPKTGIKLLGVTCDVTILPYVSPTQEQVFAALPGHDAVFLSGHVNVNSEFLDIAGPNLKVISTMSAGYDHLDVPEIKKRGIQVGHTPQVLSAAVAEIAVMLMLNAARRAHEGRTLLEEGMTESGPQWLLGRDLRGSTVGIVGLGGIGQEAVKRLAGFAVRKFLYTGHSPKKAGDELGAEFVSLDDILELSDFIVVAVPLTNETRGLFDDVALKKMKKTAVLVNVGRGAVVKTSSLLKALKERTIFAAGMDVIDPEPLPKDHELLKLPNFEIVPHLGSATVKTREEMSAVAAQNILDALGGQPLAYAL
ncbi:glyoxylate reductase/hydroxypyruvate reductase [Diachasma alloeum]|uniref:glyoxylate reductase/hydroxypyruvate reductase n=1 Tax=Diachasma alloeum TaxID=454923 RepID=UPI0007383A99|nr:glyoxylate reductase/hydroxypyruvate reductase [Diachasma alloeum]